MAITISPQQLRIVRQRQNRTQTWLSRKAKIGRRQIQRIENSKKAKITVREDTLQGLADALSVKLAVLTGEEALPEEHSSAAGLERKRSERDRRHHPEAYEVRLIKLDGAWAIVEFSKSNPVGNIAARGIPTEAAGLRLTSSRSAWVKLLQQARKLREEADSGSDPHLHPDDVGFWLEDLIAEIEGDIEQELDRAGVRPSSDVTTVVGSSHTTTESTRDGSEVDR
jgi:transcriptional regulator with XRE-family HTH domain